MIGITAIDVYFVKISGDIFLVDSRMLNLDRIYINLSIFIVIRLISCDVFALIFIRNGTIFRKKKVGGFNGKTMERK